MTEPESRKTFRFQKRFLYIEILFLSAVSIFLIASWLPTILTYIVYDMVVTSALRAALYLDITAAAGIFLFFVIKKEVMKTEFILTTDRLIRKSPYRITVVRFSEIVSISFIPAPLIRGFFRIKTTQSSLRIPLYLDNMTDFVDSLSTLLQISAGVTLNNMESARTRAIVYRNSYQRSLRAFYPLFAVTIMTVVGNAFIAGKLWELPLVPILFWAMCGLAFPLFAYFLADSSINRRCRKHPVSGTASYLSPAHDYLQYGLLVGILYLISGILFRSLFL